ncbi:hypothetical protein FRC12_018879 [Ceratobasidium sp. 428]|nr:hypothetical protein FRC12_018879 [Ceratobasidium sp. 428]
MGEWIGAERPTRWTFVGLRHRLAHITARVIEHFQDLAGGRHYDTVIQLDRELVAFSESLPALYKPDGGDKLRELIERGRQSRSTETRSQSRDRETANGSVHGEENTEEATRGSENGQPTESSEEPTVYPFLALNRFMINTEIQYVRIALHRPYVLRAGDKYNPSRTACFDAARIDRRCREIYRREVVWPDNRARQDHMGGLYRLFNSTMILGIALLLNPAGPNAAELRGYLDDFIQLHANHAAHDATSAREVKIIQLFRAKADDALRLRSPMKPGSTPQMTSQPPNQMTTVARPPRSSRGFTMDSPYPSSASRNSPPHGNHRPRSRTSTSSMTISTTNVIDNPPLPPGVSPTTAFAPASFNSPGTTTFALSNNRRSSSAAMSPTTPREAQSLLSPAPRAVSPLLMLGLGNPNTAGSNADGTPPSSLNVLGPDPNLPFTDDTQALFDQASWQYALANPGMGLGFDWSNLSSAGSSLGLGVGELGMGGLGLGGMDAFGYPGANGYGPALTSSVAGSSTAGSNAGDEGASPSAMMMPIPPSSSIGGDTPEGTHAPGSSGRVRSGSRNGRGHASEGWGYWEGLVDAIVNQQGMGGIGGRE